MRRRQALAAGASTILTASTGCLGYTLAETDRIQQRQDRVAELETAVADREGTVSDLRETLTAREERIEELESTNEERLVTLAEREDRIETLEQRLNETEAELESTQETADELRGDLEDEQSTVNSLERQVESLESEIQEQKKRKVFELYQYGATHRRYAANDWSNAVDDSEEDNYASAAINMARADGFYESAHQRFEDAKQNARKINQAGVADFADEAFNYCWYFAKAARQYSNGYMHRINGDQKMASNYFDKAQSNYETGQKYSVEPEETIKSTLELD